MSGLWNDFNDAHSNANLIPKGTLAKVRLTIRPGGFDDPAQGWTGGYATLASGTGLGLAIVKSIAIGSGGSISLHAPMTNGESGLEVVIGFVNGGIKPAI